MPLVAVPTFVCTVIGSPAWILASSRSRNVIVGAGAGVKLADDVRKRGETVGFGALRLFFV